MQAEAALAVTGAKSQIVAALHQAAAETGTDFQYLLGTAIRESGLKTQAKSATSSASGLFQFVDQTWLGLIKKYGTESGLGAYANAISQSADGRYHADSSADRRAILALRNDAQISALMAGHYASETKTTLESSLGHDVSNGELYAAHFLGADSACRLIKLNAHDPSACAAVAFPEAAHANRGVFYHADGSPKSVREVYAWATRQTSTAGATAKTSAPARLNLRQSIADNDTHRSDTLPLMLLRSSDASDSAAAYGMLPRLPLSLSSSVLDMLSSFDDQDRDRVS